MEKIMEKGKEKGIKEDQKMFILVWRQQDPSDLMYVGN